MNYTTMYNQMWKERIPDVLIRWGIRKLIAKRLKLESWNSFEGRREKLYNLLDALKQSTLAVETEAANEQHYEVPAEFYNLCLGKRKKYSSAYYPHINTTLDQAEEAMLELYLERGQFKDGESILELGCGWGSITLFLAERLPNSSITGLSNSHSQREYILSQAKERGLSNVSIITGDINTIEIDQTFDRAISIEMFEHMRNYTLLFKKISQWLNPGGTLFTHIFCHLELAYLFEVKDESDWMSKYFFSGGIMPSEDLFFHFQDDLSIVRHWRVNGTHYQQTSEDWLKNLDSNRKKAIELLGSTYGPEEAQMRFVQWRVFFMACAELFGWNSGESWFVSHYLFQKR